MKRKKSPSKRKKPLAKRRRNPSVTCGSCGTGNREGRDVCWKCGFDLAATAQDRMARIRQRAFARTGMRRRNPRTTKVAKKNWTVTSNFKLPKGKCLVKGCKGKTTNLICNGHTKAELKRLGITITKYRKNPAFTFSTSYAQDGWNDLLKAINVEICRQTQDYYPDKNIVLANNLKFELDPLQKPFRMERPKSFDAEVIRFYERSKQSMKRIRNKFRVKLDWLHRTASVEPIKKLAAARKRKR